jgi:multisubunit Na+/H+ antiporter MnhE subunit
MADRNAARDGAHRDGEHRDGEHRASRRVITWLTWWVLMMSLWVAIDDSVRSDELLAGAAAAALAAAAAEAVGHQARTRYTIRPAWLPAALRLPGQVAQETLIVFAVLARTIARRQPPPRGAFTEVPVRYGDDSPPGVTRRVLLTGARSLAPNAFVLGIDRERDVMIVHELVPRP